MFINIVDFSLTHLITAQDKDLRLLWRNAVMNK